MSEPLDVPSIRRLFPGLLRQIAGRPALFLDGPAGSQVPTSVAERVAHHMLQTNANHGGPFATSRENDAVVDEARRAFADLFGCRDPNEIVFGANMTTLTFAMSRALARTWQPGDHILVTRSDHDANVTPWVMAAKDRSVDVSHIGIHEDGTLDLDDLRSKLALRPRLFAFGAASNLTGTIHPVADICALAREAGTLTYVDAVHYAPHALIDVAAWGSDFAVCSAYKFFGPHVGVLHGRAEHLDALSAYKVRPADDHGPEKWQTGTANFACIAGALAAVDYLAALGRGVGGSGNRRALLQTAFAAIGRHEQALTERLLDGLANLPCKVHGITDRDRLHDRVATVSITASGHDPERLSARLAERGVFTWAGHSYAMDLAAALGLPDGVLRAGMLHYHNHEEVDRYLETLAELFTAADERGEPPADTDELGAGSA